MAVLHRAAAPDSTFNPSLCSREVEAARKPLERFHCVSNPLQLAHLEHTARRKKKREHIWSFAAGLDELGASYPQLIVYHFFQYQL
jgi:hypothetical protein